MSDRILVYNIAQKLAVHVSDLFFVHATKVLENDSSWLELQPQPDGVKIFNPVRTLWLKGGDESLTRGGDPVAVAFGNSNSTGETFHLNPVISRNGAPVAIHIRRVDNGQMFFVSDDLDHDLNLVESHDKDDERNVFVLLQNAIDEFLRGEPVMLFNLAMGEALFVSNDLVENVVSGSQLIEARTIESDRIDTFVLVPSRRTPGSFHIQNPRTGVELEVSDVRIGGDRALVAARESIADWTVERVEGTVGTFTLKSRFGTIFVSGDKRGTRVSDNVAEVKMEKDVRAEFLAVKFANINFGVR